MKKWISVTLCLLLLFAFPFSASAAEKRVYDYAGLLTEDEFVALNDQIMDVKDSFGFDLVILTVSDLEGKSAQSYADDFYDEHGFGVGEDRTGVLLLIAMDTREWYISTCGEAIYALTDYTLDRIGEDVANFLSSGNYYDAFECFINTLPSYMNEGRDEFQDYSDYEDYTPDYSDEQSPWLSIGIGFVAALVTVLIMGSKMNTAKAKHSAGDYLRQGTYRLNTQRDIFLYSRTSRVRRQQNNGGGGSSVHRSSGGVSHGGRGGRF